MTKTRQFLLSGLLVVLLAGLVALASVPLLSGPDGQAPPDAAAADLPTPTTQCGGTVSFSNVPAGWFLTIWPGGDPDLVFSRTFVGIELDPGDYGYEWHGAQDPADLARTDIHMGGGTFTISLCPPSDPVLIGAGDICGPGSFAGAQATAALIAARPNDIVFTAGDNNNVSGDDYPSCVAPYWGAFKARTYPAPGNHDYDAPISEYFNLYDPIAAGPNGWYSYDLPNNWHVITLNAECACLGVCDVNAEEAWLQADLAANAGKHLVAIWHNPRFSSGTTHGSDPAYDQWWRDLHAAHASVVINGHEHMYERFAPQTPDAVANPNGIREFVVGTGGGDHYPYGVRQANSEVIDNTTFGVLKLTLGVDSYGWQFIPVAGGSFTDSGTAAVP
jgi:hypothetical protein